MGTNFYWIKLPKELNKYKKTIFPQITGYKDMNILYHIGKRSAAGLYCEDCGTTFCRNGTSRIHYDDNPYPLLSEEHEMAEKHYWYEKCPICGKEGTPICSFTWTFMKQKEIVNKYRLSKNNKKLIEDEYRQQFTAEEFWLEVKTPVEYQLAAEFC